MTERLDEHDSAEKLTQLLAKLEKLDPETWNCYQHRLAPLRDTPCDMRRGKIITLSILQGVIQDAIAARGLYWEIEKNQGPKVKPKYLAHIWLETGTLLTAGYENAPAEALLAAYIQALEAEAAR